HRLLIKADIVTRECGRGDSIAVNGICLSVVECIPGRHRFSADVLQRTWECTTVSMLRPGTVVNLERALRAGDRVGGHFVLGHVDGVGHVRSCVRRGDDVVMELTAPEEIRRGVVPRGSIAVDGVSLTIAGVRADSFLIHLIPLTLQATTLRLAQPGVRVNLELDILGKHLGAQAPGGISEEYLRSHGF
ncbi:MAG: riboflavin synthase, partial [Candidatus Aureabacteria bacterium]|nr:riboflavin synthase [Candidatus Auribacterota bacterium]